MSTNHLEKKISRKMAAANVDYQLIEDGDKIMVGVSGGKDSWVMLHMLRRMQRIAPLNFEILAFHLDQGHPGFPTQMLKDHLEAEGFDYVVHSADTYSIVLDKLKPNQTTCSLCSRLRRGIMYTQAEKLGCNKIALGHHRDDIVETLMLNIFYAGQLKAMPPKLFSDSGRNMVIRPLAYCPEKLIAEYAAQQGYPIAPCTLCSRQPDLQRDVMTRLLDQLELKHPDVRAVAFAAAGNLVPTHLLDRDVYDPSTADRAPVTHDELLDALSV
jgi:tRNA 2-thiocytidine biosynthesis protein TtcA